MKDFIVALAFLMLAVVVFALILGDDSGSLKSASKGLMEAQVKAIGD